MTSVIAWLAVDSRGPAAIYLASDSRISWGNRGLSWNHGRKVFAAHRYPEIFAYCGDVLFPSLLLGQITELIDANILFMPDTPPERRADAICTVLQGSFSSYPRAVDVVGAQTSILYCNRTGIGMSASFRAFLLTCSPSTGWAANPLPLPDGSSIIHASGSGASAAQEANRLWQNKSNEVPKSRYVFGAFCDTLTSESDPRSGGAPQLVGLYRKAGGRDFGVIFRGKRYFQGIELPDQIEGSDVEWRDELFQRADVMTLNRLGGAQIHARPTGPPR